MSHGDGMVKVIRFVRAGTTRSGANQPSNVFGDRASFRVDRWPDLAVGSLLTLAGTEVVITGINDDASYDGRIGHYAVRAYTVDPVTRTSFTWPPAPTAKPSPTSTGS